MARKKQIKLLFAAYCAAMLLLLFVRQPGSAGDGYWAQVAGSYNLIPLRTLRHYCFLLTLDAHRRHAVINLVGNVVLFIPLGFLLPAVFPKLRRLLRTLLAALVIMYLVETAQIFTLLGFFDMDDLILNLLGTAVGYGWFRLVNKARA